MWKSLGDKTDIERHDEQRHPRRVRTNVPAIIILIVGFAVNSYTGSELIARWTGSMETYFTIQRIVCATSIAASLLLAGWKFRRNDREVDVMLLVLALLFLVILVTSR